MVSLMAKETTNKRVGPRTPGNAIAARRRYLGLSQTDVADRTNGIINERLLTRLENNHKSASSLSLTKYNALVSVLQWTPNEFMEATGVAPVHDELPNARAYRPNVQIPLVGTVGAGLASIGGSMQNAETLPIDLEASGLQHVNPRDLVWMLVNGDSMVSEHASRSVPQGSLVLVEVGALPRHGDMVVAWLPARDTAVIKQFAEGSDSVLRSYNLAGPVFRLGEEPLEIRGVVRLVQYKPGG